MLDSKIVSELPHLTIPPDTFDREKFHNLLIQAEKLIYSEPEQAKSLALEALRASSDSGDKQCMAKANFTLGWIEYVLGRFDIGMDYGLKAQKLAVMVDNKSLQFSLSNLLSGIEISHGRLGPALDITLQGCKIAEELGDVKKQAVSMLNLAQLYRESGQFERGLEAVQKSLSLQDLTNKVSVLGQTYRELGASYSQMGNQPEALKNLLESLEIEKTIGNKLLMADVLNNIGIILRRMDRYDEAVTYLEEALSIRKEAGDPYNISMVMLNIGMLKSLGGKDLEAIEIYKEALEILKPTGSKKGELRIEEGLAEVYEKLGDYETALKHIKIAHELHEQLTTISIEERERRLNAQAEAERSKRDAELERIKSVELVKAQRMARVGSFVWDTENDSFTGSEEFYRLLKRQHSDGHCTLEQFLMKINPSDRNQVRKAFRSAFEWNSIVDVVARAESPENGRHSTFHILGEWVSDGVPTRRLAGTLQDITIQLEADEARREREKLEGMLEMAGAFSHEINQPMQVIVTATELLLYRFPDNLEVAKSVEKILQAATRMSEITSRLSKTTTYKSKKYVGETRIIDAGEGNESTG